MNDDQVELSQNAPSLTKWKDEPSVYDLKEDLSMATSTQATAVANINTWLDNLNLTGAADRKAAKSKKGRSTVQPKLIRKQAEWRYSSLSEPFLSTEDVFNISPTTYEDKYSARQNELVLNNQFNTKMDKVKFIDEFVRTAVDEGTVILRVGWDTEEEEVTEEEPIYEYYDPTSEDMFVLQQAMQRQQSDPGGFQAITPAHVKASLKRTEEFGEIGIARQVGVEEVKRIKVTKNQPTLEICDFRSLYVDPTCKGDLSKAEFVIYSYETSRDALEKDGRYKNLEHILTSSTDIPSQAEYENSSMDTNFSDKARQKFTMWEYWGNRDINKDGTTVPIVASWVGQVMVRMEENPFPDQQHPFISVQYLPVRKSTYGEPDGELLKDNQDIIGATTRGMIDLMARSANGQTGVAKNALDAVNRAKYDRGEDFEYNPQVDPVRGFYMHKFAEIPNAAPLMLQYQNSEADSLTGVTAFSGGLKGQSLGDTATGVRGVLDAASKRELGILRRLGEGLLQAARKIISMNAEFLSEEEVVRVTNDEFATVRRDDLPGNFDLRLGISSAESDNQKAEELAFMLQTTGQNLGVEFTTMILEEIARLRKMPTLAKKISEWQPTPDPMEQKKAQLENLLLEAQIQQIYASSENDKAEADLDRAKAITEQAKAINLQAETDHKNLNFVEQESGVTQARDLERSGAQAKANIALKVVEKALNPTKGQE